MRSLLASLALALAACSSLPQRALIPVLPETVPANWQRVALSSLPPAQAPAEIAALHPAQIAGATYRSPGASIQVAVYAFNSPASAFEARQKVRNLAGSLSFHSGALFVVCSSDAIDAATLSAFSRQLESKWLGTGN